MNGFIEIARGIWYEEATGLPFSSIKFLGYRYGHIYDSPLKRLECKNSAGYYMVWVNGKMKLWHRIVYQHFNGEIPEDFDIDHKNNEPSDNRIDNLQLLSHKQNVRCSKKHADNTSGYAGIHWHKAAKKWHAKISINGKVKYLGLFDDKEVAYQAYLAAKIQYHGVESIRVL